MNRRVVTLFFFGLPFVGASGPSDVVSFTCSPRTRTSWAVVEGRSGTSTPVRIERSFHLVGDGKARRYWFDCANPVAFDGNGAVRLKPKGMVSLSSITVSDAFTGEKVPLADVVFAKDRPDIPGELCLSATDVPLAFNRTGQGFSVEIGLFNPGTMPVRGAQAVIGGLPDGVRVVNVGRAKSVVELPGWGSALHRIELVASKPCEFTAQVAFAGGGIPPVSVDVPVKVGPSLDLRREGAPETSDYVPEPKPLARGKYEIGAFYFCDWVRADQWMKVWRMDPKRKPALGWYDNQRSEVLDWQIKWSVENGISYWLVDWYGSKEWHPAGPFEQALSGARYRKYIRWALMWCNHMPPGKSREEAWTALVELWIGKYFGTSEYMRVDGMPYVSIWDPDRLDADNGGAGGCRRMLEKARAMARSAGYKGIFFQAMNNDDTGTGVGASRLQEKRREQGFDETTNYHFLGTGDRRIGPREKRYADNVSLSPIYWETVRRVPGIRYLPNLSTGWDDRPWNDTMRMAGKSPAEFRRLCTLAKAFSDRTGIRRLCLGPLNEWGEGSYVEPNGEFGFGFYEAIRETFFAKPAEGWPLNYTPADVGRELHEVPQPTGVVPQNETLKWR